MTDTIHSCGYHCERPECVLSQRNNLRDNHLAAMMRLDAELIRLKRRCINQRRELRNLHKAHRILWKVLELRANGRE